MTARPRFLSLTTMTCVRQGYRSLCTRAVRGPGATFETYCLVAEHIAQGNASTALTFNMHCLTMLMMGEIADALPMSDQVRARHEALRASKFHEVVAAGVFMGSHTANRSSWGRRTRP